MTESPFERESRELVLESAEGEGKAAFAFAPLTKYVAKEIDQWMAVRMEEFLPATKRRSG
jgi:hypothetical protein